MWKYRFAGSVAALLLLVLHALAVPPTPSQSAGEKSAMEDDSGPMVGGIHDSPEGHENDLHIIDLARFAVDQHNSKANTLLEFEKIVKVRQQVVAGMLYYFTIEVKEGEAKKLYEAMVAERQWENVKELKEFKPAEGGANA